jgi:hypothetical protein
VRRSDVAVCHVRRKSDGAICVVDADSVDPLVYDRVDAPAPVPVIETDVTRLQRELLSARAELDRRPLPLDPAEAQRRLAEEIRLRVPRGMHGQVQARAGAKRVAAIRARRAQRGQESVHGDE